MRNQIQAGKEFNIISRSVDNATRCVVTDVFDDCFKVKLLLKSKYEQDETVEFFATVSNGQIYFETIVKEADDDFLYVWFPIVTKTLQRREFSRVKTDKKIVLTDNNVEISAKIFDISAGGLRVLTEKQLTLLKEYQIKINIDNKVIETGFEPVRSEVYDDGFASSGRFKGLNNYDRIALVQYCFVKQIETENI